MRTDLPELDAEARAVLAAERDRPDIPPELAEAIYAKVVAPPAAAARPAPGPPARAGRPGWRAVALRSALPFVAGALVGGALVYAVVPARVEPAPGPRSTPTPARTAPPAELAPPTTTPVPADDVASAPAPRASGPAPHVPATKAPAPSASPSASTGAPRDSLRAEQALLEVARTALGRGNATGTLDALDRHAREFPDGKLREEREALAIEALAATGRSREAAARAAAFRARYPTSVFLPVVDGALRAPR